MNNGTLVTILAGMAALFVAAEVCSFVFKIHAEKFYRIFHFAGGALTYLLFLNLTQNRLLSLGLVFGTGVLWEIHEWVLWKFFLKKKVYKPGGRDTKDDLLMDVLGALLFYIIDVVKIIEIIG